MLAKNMRDLSSSLNFRETWLSRLLTCAAAAILVGVSIPATKFAHDATSQGRFGWEAGRDFVVQNQTFLELSQSNPDISFEFQQQNSFWGYAYYLPPGVRTGGITATLWTSGITASFAGIGLFIAAFASGDAHSRKFCNFWRVWFAVPVIVSLIAFIYSFVDTYTSDTPDVDGFLAQGPTPERPFSVAEMDAFPTFTTQGSYNIEAWTCAIRPLLDFSGIPSPGPAREDIGGGYSIRLGNYNPCHPATVARWLTLPMFLVAVLTWVLVFVYAPWGRASRPYIESSKDMEMANNNSD